MQSLKMASATPEGSEQLEQPAKRAKLEFADTDWTVEHRELVVCGSEYNNRWRWCGMVHNYATPVVERWPPSCDLLLTNPNLRIRRVKFFALDTHSEKDLLIKLNSYPWVELLELDRLRIEQTKLPTFRFPSLQIFSVKSIAVISSSPQQREERLTVQIVAPKLTVVYAGTNSLDYLKFSNPEAVSYLEFEEDRLDGSLLFANLRTLVCNKLSKYKMENLLKFATGEVGQLVQLRCNLSVLDDTEQTFSARKVSWFTRLFTQLTQHSAGRPVRKELRLYFHNIEIDLNSSEFDAKQFVGSLIEVQCRAGDRLACEFNWSVVHTEFVDIVKYFSEVNEVLHSKTARFPLPDPGFRRFSSLFGSIQSVSCSNYWHPHSRIDPSRFLDFLDCCVALISLNLLFCRFDDAFYRRLMRSPCAFSLIRLCIMEPTTFPQRVNLNFLAEFKHLKTLRTNLATRQMIVPLAAKMNHRAEFEFDFYLYPDVDPFTRCTVRRRDECEYRITTVERNYDDPDHVNVRQFGDFKCLFKVLTDYFNQPDMYMTPQAKFFHWLECSAASNETLST